MVLKYDAIIFDFDGVLVESVDVKTQAFASLYKDYGPEIVKKVVEYHLQHGGVSRFDKFRHYEEVLLGKKLDAEKEKALGSRFAKLVVDSVIAAPWVSGAKEFLDRYSKEISLFVASGTPDDEIREIVARREMSHYFISVHGTPAKKAEIIKAICESHGFDRKRVLMVGDAMTDYEGAVKAGIDFIGRVQSNEPLFPNNTIVINDLKTLTELT
jgi:phosphoglycolate phosphatase-like HAD superfamily hydrolase